MTLRVRVPVKFPVLARICTEPGNSAVTCPDVSTLATFGVPLVQVNDAPGTTLPSASLAAAVAKRVCPTMSTVEEAVTSTRAIVCENAGVASRKKTRTEMRLGLEDLIDRLIESAARILDILV